MEQLTHLNPGQKRAVSTLSGPLLILAGAGTGKTRVITYRMVELIRRGTAPDRILSVTFTNKATKEMRERTTALLGRRSSPKPVISTFHSLCVRILRQEISALGYPRNFSIYDRGDQESTARTALREIRVGDQALRPGDLLGIISRWKMAGVVPKNATGIVENDREFLAAVAYRKYQDSLRACGAVDFDDLLLITNQLFTEFPEILKRQQQRFDHVQIDEYQDTNGVQFALVEALVRPHRNLCVVGDDDQSIYGWRGADVEHILNFQSHFPGARVVRLEDNYRCTDKILQIANRLVRHNPGRHEKKLIAHKSGNNPVRFLEFPDETGEAEGIVGEIKSLIQEKNVPLAEFAILFRTNEQPRVFESELRRVRLPYVLVGGQSFFDRREIRDLMSYLKTILNPNDEISMLRIINTPARGIGTATVEKILRRAVNKKKRFWEVIPESLSIGEMTAKAFQTIESFRHLIDRYRREFEQNPKHMPDTMLKLVGEINYEAEIEKQYKDPHQQLARSETIDQLIDSMKQYVSRVEQPSLSGYLEEAALLGRDEEADQNDQSTENAIKLMTLHSAKGLEFSRVYLVGLEEGLLPHHRSLDSSESAIAEERRLAYVGITRAMDQLTISRAAGRLKWGKRRPSIPSRFLYEMRGASEELIEDESSDEAVIL
jgi:DNA helicase-2/ATP-dependent DNA helicase PcrA